MVVNYDDPIYLLDNLLEVMNSSDPEQSIQKAPIWDGVENREQALQQFSELYNEFPYGNRKVNYRFFRKPNSPAVKVYGDIFSSYLVPSGWEDRRWDISSMHVDFNSGTEVPEGMDDITAEMQDDMPDLISRLSRTRERTLLFYELMSGSFKAVFRDC